MNTFSRGKLLRQSYQTFLDKCHAIILIYGDDNTYELLQSDELFSGRIPENGDLKTLYKEIFLQKKEGTPSVNENYDSFIDIQLFKQDNYHDYIFIDKNPMEFRVFSMGENVFALYFMDLSISAQSVQKNTLKLDTITQNYLFSMIVNLADDSCQASNVSELVGKHHDYLDITYSDWRTMISKMFHPEDRNLFFNISDPENIRKELKENPSFSCELQMLNMDGVYIWVRLEFIRTVDFSEEYPVFLYTVQNIDKDMQRLLRQQNILSEAKKLNHKLIHENQEKTDMISTVSHELRTPLTSILGLDELIMRQTSDEQILSYAKNIQDAGHLLLQLINTVLDYNRMEAGKLELFPSVYSLSSLLNDVQGIVTILAKEKDLTFVIHQDETLPPYLYGDELRIKQILINLITNAIKYTKKGSVTLRLSFDAAQQNQGILSVKISDTGEGIRQEDMKKLYSSFERINESLHKDVVGTGLGMSIVLSLLKQMDSKLEVESVYGEGSTFSFRLTQGIPSSQEQTSFLENNQVAADVSENTFSLENKNILIVDDMNINLRVISALLSNTKANIVTANSGEECLSLAKNTDFDVILMDHLMPEMDGIETLKALKTLAHYENVPVIALTANVFSGSREYYRKQGFSDFLEKPTDYQSLISCLLQYL